MLDDKKRLSRSYSGKIIIVKNYNKSKTSENNKRKLEKTLVFFSQRGRDVMRPKVSLSIKNI